MTRIRRGPMNSRNILKMLGVIFVLAFASCGGQQILTTRPVKQGAEMLIRTQIFEVTSGQFEVHAVPTMEIVGGTFVYCVSEVNRCQDDPTTHLKMYAMDGGIPTSGMPTRVAHKTPQVFEKNLIPKISISAIDFSSRQKIWVTVSPNRQYFENNTSGSDDNRGSAPPRLALDRFEFDSSILSSSSRKLNRVDFDYEYGKGNLHVSQPKIRAKLSHPSLRDVGSNLGVVLGGYALHDSSKSIMIHTAANVDSQGVLTLEGDHLEPATIYKMRMHFFDRSKPGEAKPPYLGSSSRYYNFVTDHLSDQETKIRARIVMRGLAEESDWDLNRYDRSKNYTHGAGGWCHVFYNWVITPYLKTRSGSVNTHYSQSYWSNLNAVTNGSALLQASQSLPIMGDYFRVGSHAAMILAYDRAKQRFITLEGNFNNSVEFYHRSPNQFSWVGRINTSMLKPEALAEFP
jgi:hypothetical protein